MSYVFKTIFSTFYLLLLQILVFSCIFYNSTINNVKFKSFVEVYPIEGNPIEVYPIEAYLIGKGVVELSGCSLYITCTQMCEISCKMSIQHYCKAIALRCIFELQHKASTLWRKVIAFDSYRFMHMEIVHESHIYRSGLMRIISASVLDRNHCQSSQLLVFWK